jgi:hypothetical protein
MYFGDENVYLTDVLQNAKNKPFYANSVCEKQLIYFLFYK